VAAVVLLLIPVAAQAQSSVVNVAYVRLQQSLDNVFILACYATLIGPKVLVTGAECGQTIQDFEAQNPGFNLAFAGFFAPNPPTNRVEFEVSQVVVQPGLADNQGSKSAGLAILTLFDDATAGVPGLTPSALPQAGILDAMNAGNGLRDSLFLTYGFSPSSSCTVACVFDEQFLALGSTYLVVDDAPGTQNEDTCWLGAGWPALVPPSGSAGAFLAGVGVKQSDGQKACHSPSAYFRLDTAAARSFLGQFVTLP